jgi:hypothetical protein
LVQAAHAVGQRVLRGQQQHRHVGAAIAQTPQHVQPAQVRQADVQDHQRVLLRGQRAVRLRAGGRDVHRMGGLHQRAAQSVGEQLVVLDEKDAHRCPVDRRSGCGDAKASGIAGRQPRSWPYRPPSRVRRASQSPIKQVVRPASRAQQFLER